MQLSSNARKAVAAGLAASTILWAAAGVVPQFASAAVHSDGCVVLSGGVVWLITGGTRRGFTSAEVFQSSGYSFAQVVQATAEDVALPVGPIMIYADGTLVMDPAVSPLVYLVTGGQKRGFVSGSVFTGLGFSFANIQTAPNNTFNDLPTGANLDNTTDRHGNGVLVISNGTFWWMTAGGRMGFPSMAVFNSYGLMLTHGVSANSADLASTDQGAVQMRAGCSGGNVTPPVSGSMSVTLSASNPASGVLVVGQGQADLAHFTFWGSATVNSVTLKRIGVSADSDLSNVYLFDGNVRITDASSVSSGSMITFNSNSGLFTVNGSKDISVRADVSSSATAGGNVGVQLVSALSGSVAFSGAPVSANLFTISGTSSTLATVSLGAATSAGNSDPGTDILVWQSTATVSTRDVLLTRLALRQVDSINSSDINNFKLYVDGTQVAQSQSLNSNGYVTFNVSQVLRSGARVLKVTADVIGGSGRYVLMSLRGAYDMSVTDTQYNAGVTVTTSSSFPLQPSAHFLINNGNVTVSKASDSPSQNLTVGASDQSLAKYTFTAYGETVKVDTLKVAPFVTTTGTATNVTIRNVRVLVNGSQVGSTTNSAVLGAISAIGSVTVNTGTSFSTNFSVIPGSPASVEIRGDMYDANSTGGEEIGTAAVSAVQIALTQGSSNATPQVSLTPINVPSTNPSVNGNALTIASGSISVAKTSNYANQTIVPPVTGYKIGSFVVTGNATEAVNLNTIYVGFADTTSDADPDSDLSDLYVKYGSSQTSVKGTVTCTYSSGCTNPNSWSVNTTLPINGTMTFDVYSSVATSLSTNSFISTMAVAGTTVQSGIAVYADGTANSVLNAGASGQEITGAASGTITATRDSTSPVAQLVDDTGTVTTAAFKVAAVTDSYTVTSVVFTIGNCTAVSMITLKNNGSAVTSLPCSATTTFSGLNIPVAANTNTVLTTDLALSPIGVGAGTSDVSLLTTLTSFVARASGGTSAAGSEANPAGLAMYAYKALPLVSQVALPDSNLVGASGVVIAKFTVSSNGTGTVAWKQAMFEVTKAAADVLALPTLWDADTGTSITAAVAFQNGDSLSETTCNTSETTCEILVTVGANSDDDVVQSISGAKTYELRSDISGTIASTDSVSVKLDRNASGHTNHNAFTSVENAGNGTGGGASFVWSDESASATGDTGVSTWVKDYLVKNLPISWSLN